MTTDYVQALAKAYPEITAIWLIGSRVDGSNSPMSDWDYIAIADEVTLSALSKDSSFNNPAIDLLIVYDGDQFRKPWADGNRVKKVSLSNWKWQQTSTLEATYRATKARKGGDILLPATQGHARRVFP
jgi:hypothetical protein